jgi:hypothetical protein
MSAHGRFRATASSRAPLRGLRCKVGTTSKRPGAARQVSLDMNPGFAGSGKRHLGAASYSLGAADFAITASARSIAARSSSLCHVSAEWPSSNDRSWVSLVREVSSRSAAMASASSRASAPFAEDSVIWQSPSHCNYEPSTGVATTYDYRLRSLLKVRRLVRVWVCSGSGSAVGCPVPRQEFIEPVDWMPIHHPGEHIAQPCRAIALRNLGAETGRLPTTGRWRDKRPRGAASIGCVVSMGYS